MAPRSNTDGGARRPSLARRLVVLALVLLVLGVAAWAALALAFPPSRVRALARRQAAAMLARPVRFSDASVGLWPPVRLTVQQPELAEPGGFERGTAFRAASIHLDLDVLALLRGAVVVRKLQIDQPALHLVIRPDGSTNLDGLARPSQAPQPPGQSMELDVRELSIRDGRVLLDDLGASRRTAFSIGTKTALRAAAGGASIRTSGTTRVANLRWGPLSAQREADLGGGLERLDWRIDHRGAWDAKSKRLALERLAVRFGSTDLSLTGVVDDPGPRARMDLRAVGADVNLRDVMAQFAAANIGALRAKVEGRLDFDLAWRGAFGPQQLPLLTGAMRLQGGQFRYAGAPAAVRNVGFTARFAPDSIVVPALDAWVMAADPQAGAAPLHAWLQVTQLRDPHVRFAVRGVAELGMIAPLLAQADVRLGGRAAVAVEGEGRARDPGSLALSGQARLMEVSVESPRLPKKMEHIQAQIRFSPERAAIDGLQLTAGRTSLALDASATRPLALLAAAGKTPPAQLAFSLRSPYLDLDEITPQGGGAPTLPNAAGHGAVTIGRLKGQKLDVADVTAAIDLAPTSLTVTSYSAKAYGGTASGNAKFDLTNPALPVFGLETSLHQIDPNALLTQWTPARGLIHGALDANLNLGGQGNTPEVIQRSLNANGLAAVSNGTLGPGPVLKAIAQTTGIQAFENLKFRDLRLPFRVERGRMITDPVVLNGDYGRWQLVGGVGFDGSLDYAVSVALPPSAAALVRARSSAMASALGDSSGNLLLDLKVTGTATSPRVAWDARATQDRLVGKVSQAIVAQRQKLADQLAAAAEARRTSVADSARSAVGRMQQSARDSLARRARNVFEGFFQSKTAQPTPPAASPPTATAAAPDTTRKP